jgi:pimeloyl-ACP methyl ester carboxylesterase
MTRFAPRHVALLLTAGTVLGGPPASWALAAWKFHQGDPGKAAILLFHGNGSTGKAWIEPSQAAPKIPGLPSGYLDFRHTPDDKRIGKDHGAPNVGLYKVGHSDALDPDAGNWWDFLVQQGFTVATWDQDGSRFAEAYTSAKDAFARLLVETQGMSPRPPIALVGHSRGGLLIRKLLKEDPATVPELDRVRWVITLHSPHHGSAMARAYSEIGAEVVDLIDMKVPVSIPNPFGGRIPVTGPIKSELKKVANEMLRPLNKWWMADNNRELVPDGPIVRDLASGETARPGVKYYTFGGTTPTYFRLYVWLYDANSAVPQYKLVTRGLRSRMKQYFVWRVKAAEVPEASPLLDQVRDFAPELEPGKGDGFVTDRSARLSFSVHETTRLNHMEVLWDHQLQLQVLGILTAQ